ncbi:serine hydrolase domain-containing protein [uncultured Aquimarina sp.]|uniref:serine hydrolase domain-containing protein n=1 Tax=uncultured Aquimarina sp. TaxID=575652 RepID=UPI00261BFD94|nr:serine hydrolase domain-containing protein [uncultured Aquimarina sp.]
MPKPILVTISLFLTLSCAEKKENQKSTSQAYNDRFEKLSNDIPKWMEAHDVPSISFSVIEEGKLVWSEVFGLQDENTVANDSTLYLSASIAKPLTAEIFLRLASLGKVSLDEPMANHWLDPDIAGDPRAQQLTPRHVLTHQSGFKNWRRMTDGVLRFERAPGVEMGYSGEGLQYLVRFIEKKLGRPFNDIAYDVLFEPENMENSALQDQDWYKGRLAWPYFPKGQWMEPFPVEKAFGAGGLRTTTADYARFILSILNDEKVSADLRKEQFKISLNQYQRCIQSATVPEACPKQLGFGLGWYLYAFDDENVIGHTGANMGERTLAVFSPSKKSGLVAMSNGSNGNHVIYKIAEAIGVHQGFIDIEKPK